MSDRTSKLGLIKPITGEAVTAADERTNLDKIDGEIAKSGSNLVYDEKSDQLQLKRGDDILASVDGSNLGGGSRIIQIPKVTVGSYTYNGEAQGPAIGEYDADNITITGATGVNAGDYTLTLTLKNTKKCVWSDNTNAPKTYAYTISKAYQNIALSASSVTISASSPTASVTVTGNVGTLSASSDNGTVAAASVSGSTVTITSPSQQSGSAKVTVTAAATENYGSVSKTITVTADFLKIVTWASGTDDEIAKMVAAADAGKINLGDYWKVGDTRKVNLAAMSATGVGESHAAQSVSFVLMNKGGKTLSSNKTCSFIVGMKDSLNEYGYMNSSNTNSGGWDSCARRTWCNSVFRNSIPSALRGIFKQFKNVTANGSSSTTATSTDYFALPSEKEVFGSTTYADSTAESSNRQFEWYKTSSNRVKKVNGSASRWWERSPRCGGSGFFCPVSSDGSAGNNAATNTSGLSPFGCI